VQYLYKQEKERGWYYS